MDDKLILEEFLLPESTMQQFKKNAAESEKKRDDLFVLYWQKKDYSQAAIGYKALWDHGEDEADFFCYVAALLRLNKQDQAIPVLDQMIQNVANSADIRLASSQIRFLLEFTMNPTKAEQMRKDLLQACPASEYFNTDNQPAVILVHCVIARLDFAKGNKQRAMLWLDEGVTVLGSIDSLFLKASLLLLTKPAAAAEITEAKQIYEKLVEKKYVCANVELARLYLDSDEKSVNKVEDNKKALSLLESAADVKYADAQYHLGVLYVDGRGVQKNKKKGKKLIEEALRVPQIKYIYAVNLIKSSPDASERLLKAYHLLKAAAEEKCCPARKLMGLLYLRTQVNTIPPVPSDVAEILLKCSAVKAELLSCLTEAGKQKTIDYLDASSMSIYAHDREINLLFTFAFEKLFPPESTKAKGPAYEEEKHPSMPKKSLIEDTVGTSKASDPAYDQKQISLQINTSAAVSTEAKKNLEELQAKRLQDKKILSEARQNFLKGEVKAARRKYTAIMQDSPYHVIAELGLVALDVKNSQWNSAIERLNTLISNENLSLPRIVKSRIMELCYYLEKSLYKPNSKARLKKIFKINPRFSPKETVELINLVQMYIAEIVRLPQYGMSFEECTAWLAQPRVSKLHEGDANYIWAKLILSDPDIVDCRKVEAKVLLRKMATRLNPLHPASVLAYPDANAILARSNIDDDQVTSIDKIEATTTLLNEFYCGEPVAVVDFGYRQQKAILTGSSTVTKEIAQKAADKKLVETDAEFFNGLFLSVFAKTVEEFKFVFSGFQQLAKEGNVDAQYVLALLYLSAQAKDPLPSFSEICDQKKEYPDPNGVMEFIHTSVFDFFLKNADMKKELEKYNTPEGKKETLRLLLDLCFYQLDISLTDYLECLYGFAYTRLAEEAKKAVVINSSPVASGAADTVTTIKAKKKTKVKAVPAEIATTAPAAAVTSVTPTAPIVIPVAITTVINSPVVVVTKAEVTPEPATTETMTKAIITTGVTGMPVATTPAIVSSANTTIKASVILSPTTQTIVPATAATKSAEESVITKKETTVTPIMISPKPRREIPLLTSTIDTKLQPVPALQATADSTTAVATVVTPAKSLAEKDSKPRALGVQKNQNSLFGVRATNPMVSKSITPPAQQPRATSTAFVATQLTSRRESIAAINPRKLASANVVVSKTVVPAVAPPGHFPLQPQLLQIQPPSADFYVGQPIYYQSSVRPLLKTEKVYWLPYYIDCWNLSQAYVLQPSFSWNINMPISLLAYAPLQRPAMVPQYSANVASTRATAATHQKTIVSRLKLS